MKLRGADRDVAVGYKYSTDPDSEGGRLTAFDTEKSKRLWVEVDKGPCGLDDAVVASGKLAYTTKVFDPSIDDNRYGLWLHDLRTGDKKVSEGNEYLFGIGDGWVVGGMNGERNELRLFSL